MKLLKCLIPIILVFFSLQSCSDSEDEIIPEEIIPTISVSSAAISFDAVGGTSPLEIVSNSTWKINYTSSWCRPSIQASKGNVKVTITADANDKEEDRSETFTLSATGMKDVVVAITQKAKDPAVIIPDYINPDKTGMTNDALLLAAKMRLGWNLGNTMESCDATNAGETMWGNPMTSKKLIDAVKAGGFNVVRIPCAWSGYIEDAATYKIKESWLARVKEVVDYCVDNDMYVILNIHWDGGWLENNPTYDKQESVNVKQKALWKQIAIYFRDYDEHLLFAGTNEVHKDYNAPSKENLTVQMSYNQTFVDAVRATGGRNSWRNLVVQAYNTNIEYAVNYLKIPTDATANRLMSEVHFYDPYDFALQEDGTYKTQWGKPFVGGDVSSWGQEAWIDEAFGKMKTNFVNKGIPVVLGEYGAILRTSLSTELQAKHIEARNYYLNYVTKAAKINGLIPVYWDNGNAGDKGFALFNRSTGNQVHADALKAIVTAVE